jgi:hypothetical protein
LPATDSPAQHRRDLTFRPAEAVGIRTGDVEGDVDWGASPFGLDAEPPVGPSRQRQDGLRPSLAGDAQRPFPPSGKATGEAITPPLANGTFKALPKSPATLLPSTEVSGASAASSA